MKLEKLPYELSICKPSSALSLPTDAPLFFFAKTDTELSLVCRTQDVPAQTTARNDGWRAFRVCGVLDFSLTGVLSALSGVLAAQKISIFAVSTFDTDYVLVRSADFDRAADALSEAGITIAE